MRWRRRSNPQRIAELEYDLGFEDRPVVADLDDIIRRLQIRDQAVERERRSLRFALARVYATAAAPAVLGILWWVGS